MEIEANNKTYKISRKSDKYVKKLKGVTTNEAKTDVEFACTDNVMKRTYNLNSTERHGTDKNIKKVLGTLEDFLLTSMSSQHGSMQFINEGSTRRKEILAKFLDLEFFEKKFKLAKEESAGLKGALRRLEGREYNEEITTANKDLFNNEADALKKKKECKRIREEIEETKIKISELEKKIEAVPAEPIDIVAVLAEQENLNTSKTDLESINKDLKLRIRDNFKFLKSAKDFLTEFDVATLRERMNEEVKKQKQVQELTGEIALQQQTLQSYKKELKNYSKQTLILHEVPCSEHCPINKYMVSAMAVEKEVEEQTQKIEDAKKELKEKKDIRSEVNKQIISLDIPKTRLRIQNYEDLLKKKEGVEKEISFYNNNKEAIENYNGLLKQKVQEESKTRKLDQNLVLCEKQIYDLAVKHGSLTQKLENIENEKEELAKLQMEFAATDLFLRCMHSNGIAFDIINKALPILNEEISKVLANIVNFEVYFEKDGNKLDIFIHHPKHEPRPLENGSGAEKTLAAVAIRIALLNISNMPKCNLIILDEPGAALDEEHLESFTRILDMLKSYFDIVVLITHIESLKDTVDMTIDITKKDNFAYVNQ